MSAAVRKDQVLLHLHGLLEADEARDVQAFLDAGGPEADAALAEARAIEAALCDGLDPVQPGDGVREALMQRVQADRAASAAGAQAVPAAPGRRPTWPAVALAAGLAAVAAAGITASVLQARAERSAAEMVAALEARIEAATTAQGELQAQIEEQDEELAQLEDVLAHEQEILALLRSPRLVAATLTPAESGPGARMFWDWEDYRCYLHASGLPRLRPGHTYALWLRTESDELVAVTTFQPDAGGRASIYAVLPEDTEAAVWSGITLETEPVGGTPNGPRVLEWARGADTVSH